MIILTGVPAEKLRRSLAHARPAPLAIRRGLVHVCGPELHAHDFLSEPKFYPAHTIHSGYMLCALDWLAGPLLAPRPPSACAPRGR